mgnify:CR=1 FL=1|jgi:hypothetical protein
MPKYKSVKEIYIPQDKVEKVIAPWVLKVLMRVKREELAKKRSKSDS